MTASRANDLISVLSPATWPTSSAAMAATLARMPEVVGTSHLVSRSRTEAQYGRAGEATATLTIAPLKEAAGPGMSMSSFFESFVRSGQFRVTARQPGRSEALCVVGELNESPHMQAAAWAHRDGRYLFAAEAAESGLLSSLVRAFQAAASAR
jgi:hypothetical protein